jgi:hypothetical protein
MIDASRGFIKDGNKNRLRAPDIHRIVDTFTRQLEVPRYSRMVPLSEISDPKNDFNLNLPRYIDSTEPEDLQDIDGHLRGGIPDRDVGALDRADRWSRSGRAGGGIPLASASDGAHPLVALRRDGGRARRRARCVCAARRPGDLPPSVVFVKPDYWVVVDDLRPPRAINRADLSVAPGVRLTAGPESWIRAETRRGACVDAAHRVTPVKTVMSCGGSIRRADGCRPRMAAASPRRQCRSPRSPRSRGAR